MPPEKQLHDCPPPPLWEHLGPSCSPSEDIIALSTAYMQPLRRQRDIARCWGNQTILFCSFLKCTTALVRVQRGPRDTECRHRYHSEAAAQSQRLVPWHSLILSTPRSSGARCRVSTHGPGRQSLLDNMQRLLRTSDHLELFSS